MVPGSSMANGRTGGAITEPWKEGTRSRTPFTAPRSFILSTSLDPKVTSADWSELLGLGGPSPSQSQAKNMSSITGGRRVPSRLSRKKPSIELSDSTCCFFVGNHAPAENALARDAWREQAPPPPRRTRVWDGGVFFPCLSIAPSTTPFIKTD